MQTSKPLLLIALLLPAIGHAQTSQTYYFGEGQSSPQSHHVNKPTRKPPHHHHTARRSPHQSPSTHS